MTEAILLSLTIVTTASLLVLGCMAIFAGLSRGSATFEPAPGQSDRDALFIFRRDELLDCSESGQTLLDSLGHDDTGPHKTAVWTSLHSFLAARFPDLDQTLDGLIGAGLVELRSGRDDGLVLGLRHMRGLLHLRLTDTSAEGALMAIDRLSFDALQGELASLRAVARNAPALIWKTDPDGKVVWANSAYIRTLQQDAESPLHLTWPLPALFADVTRDHKGRMALRRDDDVRWFAHSETRCEDQTLHFAVPIDAAVQSEAARRETLQTLTRIFASLPIGLALFDAERRLQVFNPALIDLTRLEPIFLAARPSFEQVLYALRENRMLPEPKDFQHWRREIVEMEKAAETGAYSEEWCLDGGRTFHVTGRPQPNGAIALFIEDVTTETTLARNFRNEIETAHHVLDALPEAIVVFGLSGQALMANDGYARLWKADPCVDLTDGGLAQALTMWSEACEPTTFWARLAEFVAQADTNDEITGSAALRTGIPLAMRVRRLSGGALMVVFQPLAQGLLSGRADQNRQVELIRRPDPVTAPRETGRMASPPAEPPLPAVPARKPRTARHSSTRVRA